VDESKGNLADQTEVLAENGASLLEGISTSLMIGKCYTKDVCVIIKITLSMLDTVGRLEKAGNCIKVWF
jgi:hypothetical protein